jgi:predicted ArsR family transcriptional regulator
MHVDNWNPESFLWILQECDVPYIPDEWDKLLASYARDPSKVTGMTILGRYLSKMKLKQFKDYRWEHTEFLQELANHKIEEAMKRQGYDAAEIAQVISEKQLSVPEGGYTEPVYEEPAVPQYYTANEDEDYFDRSNGDDSLDLTDEDRTYLRLKWGKTYKPEEWVKLEQLYTRMTESYDVQGAGHEDILKLVCKTSIKANQLLDIGDVDGAQKMVKMYDSLMKSGKFTAAQNKAENGEFVNCISELVEVCEKEGFIPRYYVDGPKDRVDETLADLKNYTHSLIVEEMNLGNLIESAVKEMAKEESKEEDEDIEDELSYDEIDELKDQDFEDYNQFLEDEEISDETINEFLKGGDV